FNYRKGESYGSRAQTSVMVASGSRKLEVAGKLGIDFAGVVAVITESEPVLSVKEPPTASLVNRDSATKRARRLAVQFDLGELCFPFLGSVRSREAAPASDQNHRHGLCHGWRVIKVHSYYLPF